MLRIWLMAMLAAAMFGVVRHTDVLHRAGLTGYCTTAPHPAGTTGHWRVCEKGVLNGRPDLSASGARGAARTGRWSTGAARHA
jgi:hypothetical protein